MGEKNSLKSICEKGGLHNALKQHIINQSAGSGSYGTLLQETLGDLSGTP